MDQLPLGLDINSLPGPRRGVTPALYFRDEAILSPSRKNFALAYTIAEASIGNEIGCLLWGQAAANDSRILGNPPGVHITCWYSPWAVWLGDETFVFKAQHHDGKRLHLPLVAINLSRGFAVIPGTNNADSRPSQLRNAPSVFTPVSAQALLRAIASDA